MWRCTTGSVSAPDTMLMSREKPEQPGPGSPVICTLITPRERERSEGAADTSTLEARTREASGKPAPISWRRRIQREKSGLNTSFCHLPPSLSFSLCWCCTFSHLEIKRHDATLLTPFTELEPNRIQTVSLPGVDITAIHCDISLSVTHFILLL